MPSDSSTATLWRERTRNPSQPMIQTARPAIGAATHRKQQRDRQHEHEGERATGDRAERARDELRRRLGLDPPLDRAERPIEEPAEEPAGHVAEQAAEHPAQPVAGRAEAAGGPEARRGAQHHDEQAYSLDEHGLPRRPGAGPHGTAISSAPRRPCRSTAGAASWIVPENDICHREADEVRSDSLRARRDGARWRHVSKCSTRPISSGRCLPSCSANSATAPRSRGCAAAM